MILSQDLLQHLKAKVIKIVQNSLIADSGDNIVLNRTYNATPTLSEPKYFKVGVGNKNYWTTGELLAMAQDCERTFTNPPMEMSLNLFGKDTLVSSLWELQPKPKTFEETFDG